MAMDLKIELFAHDLFHSLWYCDGTISTKDNASFKYEEYKNDPDYEEIFTECHLLAVQIRICILSGVYLKEIMEHDKPSISSHSDFYDYFLGACESKNFLYDLTIFDRVFATCTFMATLCDYCYRGDFQGVLSIGHLCWAMYFDKSKVEFYNLGGWSQLGRVAASYVLPGQFLHYFIYRTSVTKILEKGVLSVKNFKHFQNSTRLADRKMITESWIKFRMENSIKMDEVLYPQGKIITLSSVSIENLIQELKIRCDPCASAILGYKFIKQSKAELLGCVGSKFPSVAAIQKNTSCQEVASLKNVETPTKDADLIVGTDSLSITNVDEIQSHMPINAHVSSLQEDSEKNLTFLPNAEKIYTSNYTRSSFSISATDFEEEQNTTLLVDFTSKLPTHSDILQSQNSSPLSISELDSAETSSEQFASLFDSSLNLEDKVEHRFEKQPDENMQTLPKDGVDQNGEGILATAEDNQQNKSNPDGLFSSTRLADISNLDISPCKEISQQQSKTKFQSPFKSTLLTFSESLRSTLCDAETMNPLKNPRMNCDESDSKLTEIEPSLKKKIITSKVNTCEFLQNGSFLEEAVPSNVSGKVKKKRKRKNNVSNESKKQIELPKQKNDDVADLLRMILILGDQNGIRYVCSTLHNSGEDRREK